MQQTSIAISGIEGSFSEEAAVKWLAERQYEAEMAFAISAEGAFKSVVSDQAEFGLVPLENSSGGMVLETVYAMADYVFTIEDIFEIDVRQHLLALPDSKQTVIDQIVSHPQGLAQCRAYLKRRWPKANLQEYADTALAAQDLAQGQFDRHTAVVASKRAAELYGLEVIDENIQDLKFNSTSFLVFKKRSQVTVAVVELET